MKEMTDFEINEIRYQTMKPVFEKMQSINYAVVKGESISLAAYGQLGKRKSNDIDLLVNKIFLKEIEKILISEGFVPDVEQPEEARQQRIFLLANSHQTIPYKKILPNLEVKVDANFGILWGDYESERIHIGDFLQDTIITTIHGVDVKVLNIEKAFIHLALHNYRDINSVYLLLRRKRPIYDRIFSDIYLLIEKCSSKQLEEIILISKKYDIEKYMYYMTYYANYLYSSAKMEYILNELESVEGKDLLDCYGLTEAEKHRWNCNFEERYNYIEMKDFILPQLTEQELENVKKNERFYKKI